ncbi:MAG: GAF domain-containing protein [Candidatus Sulfotelmatobacter sp.]
MANAFAVQQSEVDRESLSAVVEVQRLIAKGELDADGAMHLIVDCARDVANADGIAVAILEGTQLVYRAGSGVASSYVGRHAIASLVVSADTHASREILRVENAETDTRIEAAICRQFGAMSLIIFLIYQDRAAVGLLQVLFAEPHTFQDREVRAYRLMSGLIEDAISRNDQLEQSESARASLPGSGLSAVAQITDRTQRLPSGATPVQIPASKHAAYQAGATALALTRESQTRRQPALLATMISQKQRIPWNARWNPALAAVAAVLILTCWIVFGGRRAMSPLRSAALPQSSSTEQPTPFQSAKSAPVSTTKIASSPAQLLSAPARLKQAAHSRIAHRGVRVRKNEVDYVKGDVTIRYFTNKSAAQRGVSEHRVSYIGDDVTVRYFTPSQR